MRLAEKFRPTTLAEVIGQPAIKILRAFMKQPYASCWMFHGPGGTGKSCAAWAMAADLGCEEPFGLRHIGAAELTFERAKELVDHLHRRPLTGTWNFLLIEELERISPQCQVYLKDKLASENLPSTAIVVATSNELKLISAPLQQRFIRLDFPGYYDLASAAEQRLAELWRQLTGEQRPHWNLRNWGWSLDEHGKKSEFSMRVAMDQLQQALLEREMVAA